MATVGGTIEDPDDNIKEFMIYPGESLTDALRREALEKRDTVPFGFYYAAFPSLVPVLKNGDVFGAGRE
jgi:hypothetical protein